MNNNNLYKYILGISDNTLILGQRLGELCGHGPTLETDIALTNIALDLFGQTRSYFQYTALLEAFQQHNMIYIEQKLTPHHKSKMGIGLFYK